MQKLRNTKETQKHGQAKKCKKKCKRNANEMQKLINAKQIQKKWKINAKAKK